MRQFSIGQHVSLMTLAPLVLMALSLEAFFLHHRFSDLDQGLIENGRHIARQFASSSEYGVFSNNRFYLQSIAQWVLQQPDVRGVVILDAGSEVLYEGGDFSAPFGAGGPDSAGKWGNAHAASRAGESLWIRQPIVPTQVSLDGFDERPETQSALRQAGTVIVEMSRTRTELMKSRTLWLTLGATLLILAFSAGLVYFTSRSITMPISKLSGAVQAIGNGRLETRVSVSTRVMELSTLAAGINEMAADLQHETAALLQRVEEATRIAAIAFESHEGMMIADATGVILRVNSAFSRMTGYTPEEVVGQTPRIFSSGLQKADFYAAMWESIGSAGAWTGEIWNRRKSGEIYPVWAAITAVEIERGVIGYYVATYTDITVRKAAENEINSLVYTDALTQLPNRRMFADRFAKAMAASKRSGRYGALMFLDMDNFKPLNDRHGHAAGDLLLIEVARRLVGAVREVDTVARFGGDEFVVMLNELDADRNESAAQAAAVAEKIRTVLSERYLLPVQHAGSGVDTVEHTCTTSIGVALFLGHEASADEMTDRADSAMYRAKQDGRNTIRFFEPGI